MNLGSDPISGGLGFPPDDPAQAESVSEMIENDLASRKPPNMNPALNDEVEDTSESIDWAEKELGRKLKPFDPKTLADKYDPSAAPKYPDPEDMNEDEDAAGTLKSAHLAEWLHGMGGSRAQHHHHDPYYIDQHGKRHYKLPHGGYEGPGRSHYGKGQGHGYYGHATPGSKVSPGFEDAYGYYKGGGSKEGEGKADQSEGPAEPVRKWWTKLEKDQHNGMSARKEYDAVGADLLASGRYDMQSVARILLEKEKAKQARAAAGRLSDEDKDFAREIAKAVASHTEEAEGEQERELDEETILKAKKKAREEEQRRKDEHEAIIDKEKKAEKEAQETEAKNEDQEKSEVET